MRTINVELGDRSYPIVIKRGVLTQIGSRMSELGLKGKAAVVTNPTVGDIYADRVMKGLKAAGYKPILITVPDGEEYKSIKEASSIYDSLITHKMERGSPIVALGGGVIGDITGFVASTYLRGVPYIQVPTTLLSQVDSSVGGKTAVNHPLGKNLIGAFYQPRAVYIDPDVLSTLPEREVRAGMAEVIKYGVIWDKDFFGFLLKYSGIFFKLGREMTRAIERSCEIKAEVVGKDETEQGLRSILNLGHTFGHAIETGAGYGTFKHGEAVAIGMAMAAGLSVKLGLCGADVKDRIEGLINSIGLPIKPPGLSAEAFIESMKLDKKVAESRLRFVLITEIGKVILREVGEDDVRAFLES
ncbi:MAG: 3-dehydroquinate synthase [Deltaproteobacteria bacterium]|nr:3-dehydroquinate synthase [Deltaproteobacteria bacterium]